MKLDYLLFDASDEESGACSFDAMASVLPAARGALTREVEAVLGWAHHAFGAPSPTGEDGEWDYALHAAGASDAPVDIAYDVERAQLLIPDARDGRLTLTVTLTGSRSFGAAFRDAFPDPDG